MIVSPPPVGAAVIEFLGVLGVPVSSQVPNPRPSEFIRVIMQGGSRRNLGEADPVVIVEAWASSSYAAMLLAGRAWSALEGAEWLSADVWVAAHSASLPVDFPDPTSEQARWQFTYTPTVNMIMEEV